MTIDQYANRFVCDLVAYEPGKPIDETARELGLDPSQIVKVASNENPLGPSPLAKEAMRAALGRSPYLSGWRRLPPAHGDRGIAGLRPRERGARQRLQ
jgi:histidinol-phosphate aminotransferase